MGLQIADRQLPDVADGDGWLHATIMPSAYFIHNFKENICAGHQLNLLRTISTVLPSSDAVDVKVMSIVLIWCETDKGHVSCHAMPSGAWNMLGDFSNL